MSRKAAELAPGDLDSEFVQEVSELFWRNTQLARHRQRTGARQFAVLALRLDSLYDLFSFHEVYLG
jgi:hypothetical protein